MRRSVLLLYLEINISAKQVGVLTTWSVVSQKQHATPARLLGKTSL
jgi:hypothetical protein